MNATWLERDVACNEIDVARSERDALRLELLSMSYERDHAISLLNEPVPLTEPSGPPSFDNESPYAVELGALRGKESVSPAKPNVTSRPLAGYSLFGDDVAPETLEGAKLSSRRPPR